MDYPKARKMTQINWEEQTLPFKCYDCGHEFTTKSEAYEQNCPGNHGNKKLGN
jgi:Zn finger protein HypA/HybF involved in hydrogenase expression